MMSQVESGLTTAEVAKVLAISKRSVRYAIARGRLLVAARTAQGWPLVTHKAVRDNAERRRSER